MIPIQATAFRVTLPSGHAEEVPAEWLEDFVAAGMAMLPVPAPCAGCSEEVPADPPTLHNTSPPTLSGINGEPIPLNIPNANGSP